MWNEAIKPRASSAAAKDKCQLLNRQIIASTVRAAGNAATLICVLPAREPDGNILQDSNKVKEADKVLLDLL